MVKYQPEIVKERIYMQNGALKISSVTDTSYGTNVLYAKFKKDTFKLKLVWQKGSKVSDIIKQQSGDYGFNFPFFWDGNPVGDCKIGDKILNQGYGNQTTWHGFAYKNGQPQIGYFNIGDSFGTDGFLVKTTPLLLNGQGSEVWDWYRVQEQTASDIGKDANGNYVSAQRTFIGIDADGNFHVAVANGRTSQDKGLTLQEMALYLRAKGCIWALNGDGGSSSVFSDSTGSLMQNQDVNEKAVNHAVVVTMNQYDPFELSRKKAAEVKNQVDFMTTLLDGSGSGDEQWSLSFFEQVYDIMKSKNLVRDV